MKKHFTIIFFVFSLFSFGQNNRILFALEENSPIQKRVVNDHQLQTVTIFYQVDFTTRENFDIKKFINSVNSKIPKVGNSGYAVLDWEGEKEMALNQQKDPNEFLKAKNDFINAIKMAKKLRPNMKWSFYGFPTTNFWSPDVKWENRNNRLHDLFVQMDFFAPSLYLFYPPMQLSSVMTKNYLRKNLAFSFRLSKKYKKEVIPFIWHRYHPSNDKYGLKQVYENDFRHYVETLFHYSSDGINVQRVIWWNAENFYYNNRNHYRNISQEYSNVTFEAQQTTIFNKYLKIIKESL